MSSSSWSRLTNFVTHHAHYCDLPEYAQARLFYSRSSCSSSGTGGNLVRDILKLPLFSCRAVVCLSCGQIVVENDFVNAVKAFWVRAKYGLSWLRSNITGADQKVTLVYHYSFWTRDLQDHLDMDLQEGEEPLVRIDVSEEKTS